MRFLVLLLGVAAVLWLSVAYFKPSQGTAPVERFQVLSRQVRGLIEQAKQRLPSAEAQSSQLPASKRHLSSATPAAHAPRSTPAVPQTTIYLRNGGAISGELVSKTAQEVVLRVDYGTVGFQRAEIQRIVQGTQPAGGSDGNLTMPWEGAHQRPVWPHQHPVVIRLMKGTIVDSAVASVTPATVVVTRTLAGGGTVEQTIQRKEIDQLLFRPIRNEPSATIEQELRALFPDMHWYEEGMFTIVTDSAPPTVKDYRRTIRELATDWYLTFFPLARRRTPSVQQHVVIFEDWQRYIDYAATDGVPGWLMVGYFQPQRSVLYGFNLLGERFSALLEDVYLGQFRRARDRVSAQIKGAREEIFIGGKLSEFLQKFETAHAMVRQTYGQLGLGILRHELTHAMFHNWQLQHVVLSKMPQQDAKEDQAAIQTKRQYLQSGSEQEKRQLLEELLKQRSATPLPHVEADNSWFVEGLAGYMESTPVGRPNLERLADVQEARRRRQLLPLEFLHAFRLGSFPGMATPSMLQAYAQSWALCHFLMHRHPKEFLAYLDRLARERPRANDDTLAWLLDLLGVELRPLEQEFLAYLDQFPPENPAWFKQFEEFLTLREELVALISRW